MKLSGILVVIAPHALDAGLQQLARIAGIEIHHVEADSGRVVVVQEAADIESEVEGLERLRALPGVIDVQLVYHWFGDEERPVPRPLPESLQD